MSSYEQNLQLLIDKVEGRNDLDWQDACDRIGLDIHPDSLRKGFATTEYGGYAVAKYLMDKTASELTDDMLATLQQKKDEEYKERVRLQDCRREYNKKLREDARFENLVDAIREEIMALPKIELKSNEIKPTGTKASILVSDLHYGAVSDNVFNLYNVDVCKERMDTLLKRTLYYCALHRVDELFVNLCGDLVAGLIHVSNRVEQEEDIISQTMGVAELLSQFIAKLSEKVPSVRVVAVQGNHSRVHSNLSESVNTENFERIIFEYIAQRLNIPVMRNGAEDWICYDIGDRKVMLEHGDKTNLKQVKEKAVNLLGYAPDEILLGHFHHMEIIDKSGTDIVVNGSVMGTDSYAMKRRLNTKPYQVMRVYGEDVCTYKIML